MQHDDEALGVEGGSEADLQAYLEDHKDYRPGLSLQEIVALYDKRAETGTYDKFVAPKYYAAPRIAAETVNKYFPVAENADIKILDVAAGTGLQGEQLLKLGYTNVDALDPSASMLAVARQKGIYRNYIVESMGLEASSANEAVYDVMTTSGGMADGHIPCAGLRDMARVVKPGGVAVMAMLEEHLEGVEDYKDRLEPLMAQMEMEGKWRREERTVYPKFFFGKLGVVYVYRVIE